MKRDILSVVVRYIPFFSTENMIKTCRWTRRKISKKQILECKKKARMSIGKALPVRNERFKVMFRISNLNEETVELGIYHKNSYILACRWIDGKIYIGCGALSSFMFMKRACTRYWTVIPMITMKGKFTRIASDCMCSRGQQSRKTKFCTFSSPSE